MSIKIVLLLVTFAFAHDTWADTIILGTDEWLPYTGPDLKNPGYMTELAQRIFSKHGHDIDYSVMPYKRALFGATSGSIDCVIGASKSEVPNFILPDESFGVFSDAFYVVKGNTWKFDGVDSLKGQRLGVTGGYINDGGPVDNYIQANLHTPVIQVLSGNNVLEQHIKKLIFGRIDTVLATTTVLEAKLREMGLSDKIVNAGSRGPPTLLYIACSPTKPSSRVYVKLLSEGIRDMRESGELAKILSKYGVSDWH